MIKKKKKVKPTKVKTVKPKPVKTKPVKVKKERVLKRPRKPVVICILTGQEFKISKAMLEKQAIKLKFPSSSEYVQYYVCKDARKMLKDGFTDIEIRNKYKYRDNTELPLKYLKCYAPKIKNRERAKRRAQRKALNDFINDPNPSKYILKPKGDPKFLDMTNPDDVKSITHFACARPHIYLDNGRHCGGCNIYKHCCCPIKRLK
jgi:hypothetical protein